MKIKMVVADLDGTLLNQDSTVSQYTFHVLNQCGKAGIKVIFATARGVSAYDKVPLEKVDGHILDNGARAYANNQLCYKKLISMNAIRRFVAGANQHGYNIVLKSNATHYANFLSTDSRAVFVDFSTLNIEMEEFYLPIFSEEALAYFKTHLPKELSMYLSRDKWLMVTHAEAVKHKAIAAVAAYWGISPENIVAFGDDKNDIDMLCYAGISVAMRNAIDEVKAVAEHVCDSNDNDGVAKWLVENIAL